MAAVAANIICAWPSTAASIPAGWTRYTAWDAKYIRGAPDGVDPSGTGGLANHNHTSPAHTPGSTSHIHTVRVYSGTISSSGNATGSGSTPSCGSNNPAGSHGHGGAASGAGTHTNPSATITVDNTTNDPAYIDVIWIQSGGTGNGFPNNSVIWYGSDSLPSFWNRVYEDRYLRGAIAAGDGGGTGSSNSHTHTSPAHTHNVTGAHTHSGNPFTSATSTEPFHVYNTGTFGGVAARTGHTHTLSVGKGIFSNQSVTTTLSSDNIEPSYSKLNCLQNGTGGDSLPDGSIALWASTEASIPTDWARYTKLDDLFCKNCNADLEIDTTGGQTTAHNHTASNCLPGYNQHNHQVFTTAPSTTISTTFGAGGYWAASNHGHNGQWVTLLSTNPNTSIGVTINNSAVEAHYPPWARALFILYTSSVVPEPAREDFNSRLNSRLNGALN